MHSIRGHVLVAIADSAVRLFVQEALSRHGYRVVATGTAAGALTAPMADLAILKPRLPDMDGVELARRLVEATPRLKVLFVSGAWTAAPEDLAEAAFLGMPFALDDLLRSVDAAIGLTGRAAIPR